MKTRPALESEALRLIAAVKDNIVLDAKEVIVQALDRMQVEAVTMRNCPRCLNTTVIEDGYCGHCRECTMAKLLHEEVQELEMASMLVKWKDRILAQAARGIESHYKDGPVDDFTEFEKGFEEGIRSAVDEVCKLMADPSYFGRKAK